MKTKTRERDFHISHSRRFSFQIKERSQHSCPVDARLFGVYPSIPGAARPLQTNRVEAADDSAWSVIQNARTFLIETVPSVHVPSTATPSGAGHRLRKVAVCSCFLAPTWGDLNGGPADRPFSVRRSRIADFANVFGAGEWTRTTDLLITNPTSPVVLGPPTWPTVLFF
jgi:hypothetical protein